MSYQAKKPEYLIVDIRALLFLRQLKRAAFRSHPDVSVDPETMYLEVDPEIDSHINDDAANLSFHEQPTLGERKIVTRTH